jgi:uncharacterized membrane protein
MPHSEEAVDRTLGVLLRTGVIVAASVVLVGGIWYLTRWWMVVPDYRVFRGVAPNLRSVGGIVRGVGAFDPRSVIQLGVLLLIATPISRVGFSVVAFAAQRDRTYVATTLVVLAILICSLAGFVSPPG